jgi:hypothetical protein
MPEIVGWKLDRSDREALLRRFPPKYAEAVADHVACRRRNCRRTSAPS